MQTLGLWCHKVCDKMPSAVTSHVLGTPEDVSHTTRWAFGLWNLFCNYLLLAFRVCVSHISSFSPRMSFCLGDDHMRIRRLWEGCLCSFHCNVIRSSLSESYSYKNKQLFIFSRAVLRLLRHVIVYWPSKTNAKAKTKFSHKKLSEISPHPALS